MMKGFSLLEFLVATTLFFSIVFAGYASWNSEKDLLGEVLQRSRPEEESNYRLLILQNLILNASDGFRQNLFLEKAPFFFPDLDFGQSPVPNAFSVVRPLGPSIRFERAGGAYRIPAVPALNPGSVVVMAGCSDTGQYDWNYARVSSVSVSGNDQNLTLNFFLSRSKLDFGSLMEVEIDGFSYQSQTLYSISPSGQSEPFFGPLDEFQYSWKSPQLRIFWRAGLIEAHFTTTL